MSASGGARVYSRLTVSEGSPLASPSARCRRLWNTNGVATAPATMTTAKTPQPMSLEVAFFLAGADDAAVADVDEAVALLPPVADTKEACWVNATFRASAGVMGRELPATAEKKDSSATYMPE